MGGLCLGHRRIRYFIQAHSDPPKFDIDHFYSQAFMQIKQLCELVSFGRAGLQVLLTLARARLAVPISSFRSFG